MSALIRNAFRRLPIFSRSGSAEEGAPAKRRSGRWLIVVGVVAMAITGGYFYWRNGEYFPSTDDAYVNAHIVHVASQVTGPVIRVYVENQQAVRAGETLFELDRRPFTLAQTQAQARLSLAEQAAEADAAEVDAASAEVERQRTLLRNAELTLRRHTDLRRGGAISSQTYDDSTATTRSASAQLVYAEAKLRQARSRWRGSAKQSERVREARADFERAQLDLDHTRVSAACDGHIADFSLQPGTVVRSNARLFSLVCDKEFWADANFKETQLRRIRAGDLAEVTVDTYRGHTFHGRVLSVGSASGAAFSLLPPQNSTGNWVKVVQRVPVRVLILDREAEFPLRVGTSATVTIDTERSSETTASR